MLKKLQKRKDFFSSGYFLVFYVAHLNDGVLWFVAVWILCLE